MIHSAMARLLVAVLALALAAACSPSGEAPAGSNPPAAPATGPTGQPTASTEDVDEQAVRLDGEATRAVVVTVDEALADGSEAAGGRDPEPDGPPVAAPPDAEGREGSDEAVTRASEPAREDPTEHPDGPGIPLRFDQGATSVTVSWRLGSGEEMAHVVEAEAGARITAVLDAEPGVWLELRNGAEVILPVGDLGRRVVSSLPSGGAWRATVFSSRSGVTDYTLTVRVFPPATGPVVYLTFDDGPHPVHTPAVLDILGRYGARATFFVLGKLAARHPELIERIVAEGHTVANHTWNHENLTHLSRAQFDATIGRTQDMLGDHATPCLRPPYGSTNSSTRDWAANHGLEVFMWTVSANDWEGLDGEAIADRLVAGIVDQSIVLMHDGGGNRSETVRGLEITLDRLAEQSLNYELLCKPEAADDPSG